MIDWGTRPQEKTTEQMLYSCSSAQEESKLKKFFVDLDNLCQNNEGLVDKMISLAKSSLKSIFNNQSNQNEDNQSNLIKRLKGYFAMLFYFDLTHKDLAIPEYLSEMLGSFYKEFDTDGNIQSSMLSYCSY